MTGSSGTLVREVEMHRACDCGWDGDAWVNIDPEINPYEGWWICTECSHENLVDMTPDWIMERQDEPDPVDWYGHP